MRHGVCWGFEVFHGDMAWLSTVGSLYKFSQPASLILGLQVTSSFFVTCQEETCTCSKQSDPG